MYLYFIIYNNKYTIVYFLYAIVFIFYYHMSVNLLFSYINTDINKSTIEKGIEVCITITTPVSVQMCKVAAYQREHEAY